MIKAGVAGFFLLAWATGYSQDLDSVLINKTPRPYFSLDSRNTAVQNNAVRVFGAKLGLEWVSKYRAGFGYYTLTSSVREKVQYEGKPVKGKLHFAYTTIFAEYQFFSNKKWVLNAALHNGIGQSYLTPVQKRPDLPGRIKKQNIWLLEPQVNGHYKILDWLALGGGLGLRKTLIPDLLETNNFNGGVVSLNFQVFPLKAYRAIKKTVKNPADSTN